MANIVTGNSSLAAAVSSFRHQSKIVNVRRPKTNNTFGIPSFLDRYVPTDGAQADVIRILRGNYESPYVPEDFEFQCNKETGVIESVAGTGVQVDYATQHIELPSIATIFYMWTKHYVATSKKTLTCSGGPLRSFKQLREPCPCCDEYQDGTIWENGKKVQESSVSRQGQYSFVVVHYKKHHHIPQTDQHGQVLKSKKGEAYMTWEPCKGRGCVHCLTNSETVDYRIKHWDLGFTNYNEIVDGFCTMVGGMCGNCNARNNGPDQVLSWEAFTCPICSHVFFDDTTLLSDAEIQEVVKNPMLCPNAALHPDMPKVLPIEHILCSACNQTTARADICDVNLYVSRTLIAENKYTLNLVGFSDLVDTAPAILEEAAKFDLPKYFVPASPEIQMQSLAKRAGPPARGYTK